MNKNKFKALMVLNGDTQSSLADVLGVTESTLSHKVNEKGTQFTLPELRLIKTRYKMTSSELDSIFFEI